MVFFRICLFPFTIKTSLHIVYELHMCMYCILELNVDTIILFIKITNVATIGHRLTANLRTILVFNLLLEHWIAL